MLFFRKKNKKIINTVIGRKSRGGPRNGSDTAGKIFVGAVIFSFVGVTAFTLFFSSFLAIRKIDIQGTEKIDPEKVRGKVYQLLSGEFLDILPRNNIILAQKSKLRQVLSDEFKLIESIKIEKKFPASLSISIAEKKPTLILRTAGKDYVIDEKGIAYDKSDFESDFLSGNNLMVLVDESNKNIDEKEGALSPEYINLILSAREYLSRDLDIAIDQRVTTPNIISGDLLVETSEGWKIYFNKEVGLAKEIEMLKAVLDGKIATEKRKELEYIDLRTDNKVYYRLRNTEQKRDN